MVTYPKVLARVILLNMDVLVSYRVSHLLLWLWICDVQVEVAWAQTRWNAMEWALGSADWKMCSVVKRLNISGMPGVGMLPANQYCKLMQYLQILQRWEKNKKYSFKAKFRKYRVSTTKFFSPKLVKTSQWAEMTLEIRYTVSQPEKIHTNMFAIFRIAASFLPDIAYFGKRM